MKNEPVAYRILDSEASKQYGISKHVYFDIGELRGVPEGKIMKPLYTEAQMRQLGEACAAVCERTPKMQAYGNNRAVQDECAAAIRKLIKEMLPSAELAKQEKSL